MSWDEIFDLISSEYGWKTEYILSRTLFEINWRVERIVKRKNYNYTFEMAIHGIKPQHQENNYELADKKLDDNQKKAMNIALERAKERKRLEFLSRRR